MCVRARVCVFESQHCGSFTYFGQLLRCIHKRIVNIMKVYIERNNMQVELTRFRKKIDFIGVYVCEAWKSMRPTCLRLASRYNIRMPDSIHFNYP